MQLMDEIQDGNRSEAKRWWFTLFVGTVLPPLVLIFYFWMIEGREGLAKSVTQFLQPVGLLWLPLNGFVLASLQSGPRRVFVASSLFWIAYTLLGSGFLAGYLTNQLEVSFVKSKPFQEAPMDAIIVLGGGMSYSINGEAQFSSGGDRVGMAARLYHRGLAKHVICTGKNIDFLSTDLTPDPAALAKQVLVDVKVPAESITELGGRNTQEEMAAIHELMDVRQYKRVGLVTSAWHMERALELSKAEGLDLVPLPCDYGSSESRFTILGIIPNAGAMKGTAAYLKEQVGRLSRYLLKK